MRAGVSEPKIIGRDAPSKNHDRGNAGVWPASAADLLR